MKLTGLNPRWVSPHKLADGVTVYIGMTFLCPHCRAQRIAVMFKPVIDPAGCFSPERSTWCDPENAWFRKGGTFETISISPSIDLSKFGHWHGVIENGEVK
jgi:hypothetical protein